MKRILDLKLWTCISLLVWNINVSKAQQTGPNSPDFYGFEPVDATDMVDLSTGDLTYTIPLMSVPGPGGGYPIVLSYSAGVGVGQESTWVGMGWRLTPGGIHRSVSGAPDDVDMRNWNYSFASGTMEYTTAGVSYSDPSGLMSFGITKSWGDYNSIGVNAGYGPLSINADDQGNIGLSVSPLETFSPSKAKESNPVMSLSVGVNYNAHSKKGVGYTSFGKSGVGVSLSGNLEGSSFNASYMGNSLLANKNVSNNESFTTHTKRDGLTVPIPTPVGFFSLSFSKTKVDWQNKELTFTKQVGLLNDFDTPDNLDEFNRSKTSRSMDVLSFTPEAYHFQNKWEGDRTPSIMLPAYDNFNVVAQGMSFSMQNRLMETGMLATYGNVDDLDRPTEFYGLGWGNVASGDNHLYQVSGSNSGSWQINPGTLDKAITANDIFTNDALHAFHYEDEPTVSYVENDGTPHVDIDLDYIDYGKFGKKNIRYYTNQQIIDGNADGFIEANCLSISKRQALPVTTRNGIGGYAITNEQGVTYHYSLPVYQKETVSGNFSDAGDNYTTNFTNNYYASSWLLTAITGPDYVDVSNQGEISLGDYGYWVRFDYGMFSDGYTWVTNTDYEKNYSDSDHLWKSMAHGLKDIYYLDKIQTETHTALFFKGKRKDGTSAGSTQPPIESTIFGFGGTYDNGNIISGRSWVSPTYSKIMSLDKIALFSNDNLPVLTQVNHDVSSEYHFSMTPYQPGSTGQHMGVHIGTSNTSDYPDFQLAFRDVNPYQMDNILDFKEYETYEVDIVSKALKIIDLKYNYDIKNGGFNSESDVGFGKLTLSHINELSRDAVLSKPPMKFEYYLENNMDMTGVYDTEFYNLKKQVSDEWGYYNPNYNQLEAHSWSLKSIETPIGAKMNIIYEEDEYINEYALGTHLRNMVTDIEATSDPYVYELRFPNRFGNMYSVNETVDLLYSMEKKNTNFADWKIECKIEEINAKHDLIKVRILNAFFITQNMYWQNIPNLFEGEIIPLMSFDKDIVKYQLELVKQTLSPLESVKGGGIRVAEIQVTDDINTYSTKYDYVSKDGQTSSGYTSFTPKNYFRPYYIPYNALIPNPGVIYEYVTEESTSLIGEKEATTTYEFDVPKVCENCYESEYRIRGGTDDNPSYFFKVTDEFNQNNIVSGTVPESQDGFSYYSTNGSSGQKSAFSARESIITNRLNKIGELKQIKRYNSYGQCIYAKTNTYEDNVQAVKEEGYYNRKVIGTHSSGLNKYSYLSTLATYKEIPRKLSKVNTTSSGISNTIEYKDYDLFLGIARTTLAENSLGDKHRIKTIYAHEVYPEMGPKSEDITNKNMLTQEAVAYLYIDNDDEDYTNDPVIDASVTTWKKDWDYREYTDNTYQTVSHYPGNTTEHKDIWRKHTTYSWRNKLDEETGAYLGADGALFNADDEFRFDNLSLNSPKWVQNSEVTLYDHYSNPREVKDVNGQYASSKTWNNLTVSNIVGAAYSGYCASGAEELLDGVNYTSGNVYFETETMLGGGASLHSTEANVHTGDHSVKVTLKNIPAFVSKFQFSEDSFDPKETYMLSVWVKGDLGTHYDHVELRIYPNSSVSNPIVVSNPEIIQAGEWYQLRYTFQPVNDSYILATPSEFKISIGTSNTYDLSSGAIYFDDYRLYPIGASISTYVYDDMERVEYILDGYNLATKYVYNEKGRLEEVYSEVVGPDGGFVKTASSAVHFIRDNE